MKNLFIVALACVALLNCKSTGRQPIISHKDTVQAPDPPVSFQPLNAKEIERYHNEVEDVLNHTLLRSRFNGSILIAKNGTIVYEKYIGYKNPRTKEPLTAETAMQIASTSKTLTSAAVLQLIHEGKLSINDPVEKFFPGFPYPDVTVKMLLTHRSGLPNYIYYMDKSSWDKRKLASNQDVLNTLFQWKPVRSYRPGIHFHYCNTNYVLLALIIEKVTGQLYPDYMKNSIFNPLGMSNTFVHSTFVKSPGDSSVVTMSYKGNGGLWPPDYSDGPYGDKNIYSTPRDLLKWDQALYMDKILDKQMQDSAFTPYSNERPGIKNYGLGWRMLVLPNGKKVIYHNGHWHGFNSAFVRLTDEKATIIILSNRLNHNVYTTAKKLYNLFGNYDGKHEDNGEE